MLSCTRRTGERLLGRARLLLNLGERIREGDDELAVALALVLREREDTGQVVVVGRLLLLGKVAHNVKALRGLRFRV